MFRKITIGFFSGLLVGVMRLFRALEEAKINTFSANGEMRLPLLGFFVPRYTNITRLIVRCLRPIHAVLLVRYFAQIAQSIVGPIAVYVINFAKRPESIYHSHSNSVRWNYDPINANFNVSIAKGASAMPSFCPLRCILPCEVPGVGVIGKFFAQGGYRNFSHSHGIPHLLNGGKYASIIG